MAKKEVQTKRMFVAVEMMASGEWPNNMLETGVIDEVTLSLGTNGNGFEWEFGIKLIRLGDRAAMKVGIFSDAWRAFTEAPEIFKVLREFGADSGKDDEPRWPRFLLALEAAGWKRVRPEPRKAQESKACTVRGK